ncbi:uncharacterized protein EV420DRAFT_1486911 [Desarmillaria tabescens]|uniref:Secreted protein n=1 Tax=Armillaria tabescens TaxID=1929756 RepID=A0AA39J950_ARMTA|nr:uncharacterized protein EV420DRAFT_1486911 [Desarmillaria tabescens]KAK0437745.1 hypothetical protein EV420DRAFT_1486911 [Desarmillaria tabescens]
MRMNLDVLLLVFDLSVLISFRLQFQEHRKSSLLSENLVWGPRVPFAVCVRPRQGPTTYCQRCLILDLRDIFVSLLLNSSIYMLYALYSTRYMSEWPLKILVKHGKNSVRYNSASTYVYLSAHDSTIQSCAQIRNVRRGQCNSTQQPMLIEAFEVVKMTQSKA